MARFASVAVLFAAWTASAAPAITAIYPPTGPSNTLVSISGSGLTGVTKVTFNGIDAASFSIQNDALIQARSPIGATSGPISVTHPSGTATSTLSFTPVPAPTILSLSPTSGMRGDTIVITGTQFTGVEAVRFSNNLAALFTVIDSTHISVVVPGGAVSGPIRVYAEGGSEGSPAFGVVSVLAPTVTSFNPTSALPGRDVMVTGTDFTGTTGVKFNEVAGINLSVLSDTSLRVRVPIAASTGLIAVTNSKGTGTSANPFVISLLPVVTSFAPLSGVVGTQVTLTGTDFGLVSAVKLGSVSATFTVVNSTTILATVPDGVVTQSWVLTTSAGDVSYSTSFGVLSTAAPTITSFLPTSAYNKSTIDITGTNFVGTSSVKLNAASCAFTLLSSTKLKMTVIGTVSGPITITNTKGSATSVASLIVLPNPTATGFSPSSGPSGTSVTVAGTGLDRISQLKIGNTSQTITSKTASQLVFAVGAVTQTGVVTLTDALSNTITLGTFNVVLPGPPTVTGFVPMAGTASSFVRISGTNLGVITSVQFNGVTSASLSSITDTSVSALVPGGASSGPLTVTTLAGSTVSAESFTVIPSSTLTSMSPLSGILGTPVVLTGTYLDDVAEVSFGSVEAPFTIDSPTQITTAVPGGSRGAEKVKITGLHGEARTKESFQVLSAAAPTIENFLPKSGDRSTTVFVYGSQFTGTTSVRINAVEVSSLSLKSDTALSFNVPATATTGSITISNSTGEVTSLDQFVVVPPPTLTSFSPQEGGLGTRVTIVGAGIDATKRVYFGTASAPFTIDSSTQITTQVPDGAKSGPLALATSTGIGASSVVSATPFTVLSLGLPTVTSINPSTNYVGKGTTVRGTHFLGTTDVSIENLSLPFTVQSDVQMVVTPEVAVTGPLTVTNSVGSTTSVDSFTTVPAEIPRATTIAPSSGIEGTQVTITGTNLSHVTRIRFGSYGALFTVNSPTSITLTVPSCRTTGLMLESPNGTVFTSEIFTCLPKARPTINDFSPKQSATGGQNLVGVTGSHLFQVTEVLLGDKPVVFNVQDDFSLGFTLPSNAVTAPITVTNALGSATSTSSLVVTTPPVTVSPSISAISPLTGSAGTTVTVNGHEFNSVTSVKINGVLAQFVVVNSSQLTVIVPPNATSGFLAVSTPGGTASSTPQRFEVTSSTVPVVNSFAPTTASPGMLVVLKGSGFVGTIRVRLSGASLSTNVVSNSEMKVLIPEYAYTGTLEVTNSLGTGLAPDPLTIVPMPRILRIAPFEGVVGSTVVISGVGLGQTSQVRFGNAEAAFVQVSDSEVRATVPSGAAIGPIVLTIPTGTLESDSPFLVKGVVPTIASFTPSSGGPTTTLFVTGTGFTGTLWVAIGGLSGTTTVLSDSLLKVGVNGASNQFGPSLIEVATSAGVATSSTPFTFLKPLTVSFVNPREGAPGAPITIAGTGLSTATSIDFNGVAATLNSVSDTSVSSSVPMDALSGPIRLTGIGDVEWVYFSVLSEESPTIASFSPLRGGHLTTVIVKGNHFRGTQLVTVGGAKAPFTIDSDTQLSVSIQSTFESGRIAITNSVGAVASTEVFEMVAPPFIANFSPLTASLGQTVVINGKHLSEASQVRFGTTAATFTIGSDEQLTARVPPGAQSGLIRVTTLGGEANGPSSFTVAGLSAPLVTAISPTSGGPGTQVTLTGVRFTGTESVRFNMTLAKDITVVSETVLTVIVPSNATTGPVTVSNSAGSGTSTNTFTIVEVPQIQEFVPAIGKSGDPVVILGKRFTGIAGVQFNGRDALFTVENPNQISTTVPPGATSGKVSVITATGSVTSAGLFTVLATALPSIASFSPGQGQAGIEVRVLGTHFTAATQVLLGGAECRFKVISDEELRATVPMGAHSGPISVRNALGMAVTMSDFEVLIPPRIDGFSPLSGKTGDLIAIEGFDFSTVTSVKFNGVGADFTFVSNTALTATVPAGTTTGPITVVGSKGTGKSEIDFIITNPAIPVLAEVTPRYGSTAGNSEVTIVGSSFANGATVKFGTASALSVTYVDATKVVVLSPPQSAGVVSVEVTNPDGQVGMLENAFTYVVPSADGGIEFEVDAGTGGSTGAGGNEKKSGCGCASAGPLDATLLLLGLLAWRKRRQSC